MASNTELQSGYDYDFVLEVPEDYICIICQLTMRKPVQTKCGHRFCKECLDAALARQQKCPLDNKLLTSQQIFEDVATERQILSLKIKCPNHCDWQGELRDVQNHDEKCPLTIVPCFYGTIGCNFKGARRYLSDHYKNNMEEHLTIATSELLTIRKQVSNTPLMKQEDHSRYSYIWRINDFSKQSQLAKQQDRDIRLYSEPFYTHKYGYKMKLELHPNGYGDGKGTHVSVGMIIMRGEYDAILTWPFNWKFKFTLLDQKPDHSMCKNIVYGYDSPDITETYCHRPTTDQNTGIGYDKFVSHETLKTENYVKDGAVFIKYELENPCQPPSAFTLIMTKEDQSRYSFVWKINDFSKQLQLAKQQDRNIILYSEPFHTHKYGYKLKLRLDPNRCCDGKGTHVSVFMINVRGEYDAILTWPFNWKWKLTLLDQKADHSMCKNIEYGYINPDTSHDAYQRPTKDENTGIGNHTFVSHETLKTENYVVDGVLFIKFELENPSP